MIELLALLFLFVCLVMAGGTVTSPDAPARYVPGPDDVIAHAAGLTVDTVEEQVGLREPVSGASARLVQDRTRLLGIILNDWTPQPPHDTFYGNYKSAVLKRYRTPAE